MWQENQTKEDIKAIIEMTKGWNKQLHKIYLKKMDYKNNYNWQVYETLKMYTMEGRKGNWDF